MDEAKSKAVLFKLTLALLEQLDAYAEKHCEGNRSLAIRRGIQILLRAEEQDEESPKGTIQLIPVSSHKGNRSVIHGKE